MIVRSIVLEAWRCFVAPTCVGPFSEGINVVHAPNGTGKSTLFEALRRGLLDNHAVTGTEVEALRPWGRVLAPSVTVEFAHGADEYRMTKRFLDKAASELHRLENGAWTRLDAGPRADERVRKLLTQRAPGRGLSRADHWGLAQVLWAPQGDLRLPRPANDVVAEIRNALGAQLSGGAEGSELERRIEARYLQYFAPVTGQLRRGRDAPAAARALAQLDEVRERCARLREEYEAFSRAARRVDELRAARESARRRADALSLELSRARAACESYLAAAREHESHAARAELSRERHRALHAALERTRRARRDLADATREAEALAAEESALALSLATLEQSAREAQFALSLARQGAAAVERAEARARAATRLRELGARELDLRARIERATDARAALESARVARDTLRAPDARALREARALADDARRARERWEESLVGLEITAQNDSRATVLSGEPGAGTTIELPAGRPVSVRGLPEAVLEIPGFGRVRAVGPASTESLERDRARTHERLARTLAAYDATDLDALESLAERARAADTALATARTRVEALLDGDSSRDLDVDLAGCERERDEILRAEPDWRSAPPDERALTDRSRELRQAHDVEVARVRDAADAAAKERDRAERTLAVTRARREDAHTRALSLRARLDEETAGASADDHRERELAAAALEFDAARERARVAEQSLRALGPDPRAQIDSLEVSLRDAEITAQNALESEKSEEGRLEHLGTLGTYSQLAQADEELQRLETEARDEALRANAVRLLRNAVAQCRAEAVASVAAPVQEEATRTLWRIAGDKLGAVRLGDGFEPAAVAPALADGASVELDSVSGGEREQIHLATRLALADVLARDERQMVVLDDVLTATDSERLGRVLRVLEEKSQRLQVLLITCHPERYRGLERAAFFDLAKIVRGG